MSDVLTNCIDYVIQTPAGPGHRQIPTTNLKGLGSSNLPLSANQSSAFAFSAEKSKILRTFGTFVRFKGTGESQIQPPASRLGSILSVENRAGALSRHLSPRLRSLELRFCCQAHHVRPCGLT